MARGRKARGRAASGRRLSASTARVRTGLARVDPAREDSVQGASGRQVLDSAATDLPVSGDRPIRRRPKAEAPGRAAQAKTVHDRAASVPTVRAPAASALGHDRAASVPTVRAPAASALGHDRAASVPTGPRPRTHIGIRVRAVSAPSGPGRNSNPTPRGVSGSRIEPRHRETPAMAAAPVSQPAQE